MVWIEILKNLYQEQADKSPPARVVWIEMRLGYIRFTDMLVATREGGVD